MVQKRTCDYTGEEIEPGTGKMYVKTDGTILWFKDSKAEKNYLLGRESRDLEWIGEDEPEGDATTEADESETKKPEAKDESEPEDQAGETDDAPDGEADSESEAVEAETEESEGEHAEDSADGDDKEAEETEAEA